MIIKYLEKYNGRKIVLLECDVCGKEHTRRLDGVNESRKKRGKNIDVCRSCSFLPKYRNCSYGKQRYNWKGGKYTHAAGYEMLLTYPEKKGAARYEFVHVLNVQEKFGRKLYRKESVHHINCNKKNNDIDNLFLCNNEREHQKLHVSMKKCGYKILDKYIYFNRSEKKYQLSKCKNEILKEFDDICTKYTCHACRGVMYAFVRIHGKTKRYHVFVIENLIGRKITRDECVHHIDGDTINNKINNLCLMTNSEHAKCHRSIEYRVAELYDRGVVSFNKKEGQYFIAEK